MAAAPWFVLCGFSVLLIHVLLLVLAWSKNHAKGKGMQYTVLKYLFVSVAIDWFAFMLNIGHFGKFAQNGIGQPGLEAAFFCKQNTHTQHRKHKATFKENRKIKIEYFKRKEINNTKGLPMFSKKEIASQDQPKQQQIIKKNC